MYNVINSKYISKLYDIFSTVYAVDNINIREWFGGAKEAETILECENKPSHTQYADVRLNKIGELRYNPSLFPDFNRRRILIWSAGLYEIKLASKSFHNSIVCELRWQSNRFLSGYVQVNGSFHDL